MLDEGIDVPDANLGIVMSASRTRRQMIQRMGRILRRKRPGVGARFVIMFAKDTIEDPRVRLERDGFLDEIERIALASRVFDSNEFDELGEFLDRDGPLNPIEPERVGPMGHGRGVGSGGVGSGGCAGGGQADRLLALRRSDPQVWACVAAAAAGQPDLAEELEAKLGAEVLYAHLNYLEWDQTSALHEQVWERDRLRRRNPARLVDPALYIDIESVELPEIAKPRVPIKTLSTGAAPIELRSDGSTWMICCTGCGACSEPVRFRWQALDQTVQCRCP